MLLSACTIACFGVAVGVALVGADTREELGAGAGAVGGVCFGAVLLWFTSPPGTVGQRLTDRTWLGVQVVGGVALVAIGVARAARGDSDGWWVVVVAVGAVLVTQLIARGTRR